jgi:GNAT superfamily N-acetyltransferase
MATRARASDLEIRPLTAARLDDLGQVTRGTWGSQCWCMHPRLTDRLRREQPPPRDNRTLMGRVARRRRAPGLLAYRDGEPIGWVAVAPRPELARVDASKATPRVDDVPVWVIPCITVARRARGQGVAVALIRAAVAYAAKHGAPAVEAYPRADKKRVHDDFAFIGTDALFRRAGFRTVRGPLPGRPRSWTPRVTMRVSCTSKTSPPRRGRSRPA